MTGRGGGWGPPPPLAAPLAFRTGGADGIALLFLLAYAVAFVSLTSGGFADADDRYYLQAADAWRDHPPVLGTTHWALRLPLVLAMAAATRLGGRTELAGFVVPATLCVGVLMAATFALVRPVAGRGTAVLAGMLAVSSPVVAIYGRDFGPDGLEAALCAASFALFVRAWQGAGRWGMAGAGLLLGVCWVDRATCAPLLGVYGLVFLGAGPARWRMVPLFVGFAVPLAAEAGFLVLEAGTPFYRFGVDAASLEIPSNHMIGQVAGGLRPPFNWRLMARWRPNSAVDVHWALNPFIDLVTNPQHGWLLLPGAVAAAACWRGSVARPGLGWLVRVLCAWAVLILLAVLVVFNLRPQPRYFLTLTWIAGVLTALWAGPRLEGRWRVAWAGALAAVVALDLLAAQYRPDPVAADRAMVRHLQATGGAVWTTAEHGTTMLLLDGGLAGRVLPLPAGPGGPVFLTAAEAEAGFGDWPVRWREAPAVPWPLRLLQPVAAALNRDLRRRGPDAVMVEAPG